MQDIASKRRDNVALFKKIFLFVKMFFMLVAAVLLSVSFVWSQYAAQLNRGVPTMEGFTKYYETHKFLVVSQVVCSFVAGAFIAFLVLHGIQYLVVKFMMRKANTGG
jgi:hypothetical protein